MKFRQSGFTLVEIAIVLVIVGLLLGGVLKGQELISNTKVKNVVNNMKGAQAAYNSYQDRFRAIPGDDISAPTRFPAVGSTPVAIAGNGNGAISGGWFNNASGAGAGEGKLFWQHVRRAGLADGTPDATVAAAQYYPTNPYGGILGISSTIGVTGLNTGTGSTCSNNLPPDAVMRLEIMLDDDNPQTGGFQTRANLATGAAGNGAAGSIPRATVAAAGAGVVYTVCTSF